jgi:NTP pyrophosphatase (non-canonical NTP hydrolase)
LPSTLGSHLPSAAISIEAAELQELFLWKSNISNEDCKKNQDYLNKISEEIADITIYLLYLSYDLGIEIPSIIDAKIGKNQIKYPLTKQL